MTMTHMQYIRPGDELILKGTPDITYVWNQPPYSRFVWNGTALEALGTGSGGSLVVRSDTVTGNALITNAPAKVFAITRISGTGTYSLHNGVTTAAPIPTGWDSIDGPTGTPYTPTQEPTELVNGGYFELVSGTGTFLIVWALGAE